MSDTKPKHHPKNDPNSKHGNDSNHEHHWNNEHYSKHEHHSKHDHHHHHGHHHKPHVTRVEDVEYEEEKIMTEKARTVIALYGWDKKKVKECERAFRHFDKDGDGSIDSLEVIEVMRVAGQNPTMAEVDAMMAEADESGDGVIDFAEFIALMHKHQAANTEPDCELKQAFKVFDKDNSGAISRDELKNIMQKLGDEPIGDDIIDQMIREADINGDGVIQYEEFSTIMQKLMDEESDDEAEVEQQRKPKGSRGRRK